MGASIHPTAIVEAGAQIADTAEIGPYCHISAESKISDGVVLKSHIVTEGRIAIGEGCTVYPFAVLGAAPQHLAYQGEDTTLVIGKRNIIREHVTMHRATVEGGGETFVGNDNFFMAASHVAHDCRIGNHVVVANNSLLGGHVIIEDFVFLGGGVAIHQHCQIGTHAFLGGCAAVIHDVIPYGSANGNYARLEGLNIIGLKRRGFSRDDMANIRAAYKTLFHGEGPFQGRLDQVEKQYTDNDHVMMMVSFIKRDRNRPIMMTP